MTNPIDEFLSMCNEPLADGEIPDTGSNGDPAAYDADWEALSMQRKGTY